MMQEMITDNIDIVYLKKHCLRSFQSHQQNILPFSVQTLNEKPYLSELINQLINHSPNV